MKSAAACDMRAVVVVITAINGLLAALVGGVAHWQCQQNRKTEPCQPRSGTQTDKKRRMHTHIYTHGRSSAPKRMQPSWPRKKRNAATNCCRSAVNWPGKLGARQHTHTHTLVTVLALRVIVCDLL